MRVLRLILRDFLSYGDLDLDLSDIHVAAIVGKVGAGKSSLLDAIVFALYGKTRYGTLAEAIRDEEGIESALVRLDFETEGEEYTIERTINRSGQGNSLRFLKNGIDAVSNERRHTMPETQRAIVQRLGLNYEAARAGAIMRQGESDNFMAMDPKDRKGLLTRLLGLDRYEKAATEAKTLASGYAREAGVFQSQIDALREVVEGESAARRSLMEARQDLATAQADLDRMNAEVSVLREKKAALAEKARHADSLRQTVAMLQQRIQADQQEQKRILREVSAAHQMTDQPAPTYEPLPDVSDMSIAALKAAHDAASQSEVKMIQLDAAVAQAQSDLEHMERAHSIVVTVPCKGEGIYATCRFLSTAPAVDQIEGQRARYVSLLQDRSDVLVSEKSSSTLLAEYEALVQQKSSVEREHVRRESEQAQWQLKIDQAKQAVASGKDRLRRLSAQVERDKGVLARSLDQLRGINTEQTEIDAVDAGIGSLSSSIEEQRRSLDLVYQPALRQAEETVTRIAAAKEQVGPLEKQFKEASGKGSAYGLVAKAFHRNGVPTYILDTHIPLIEQRANEVLERMPEQYIVRLVTQAQDRLTIVVETKGRTRAYEGLSGGERFRVDFALRVAISQLQAGLSGTSWRTYIIDEGFGSQDDEGIDAMLESIASIQDEFGLILAISHQKALSDRVERHIEVSKDFDGSTAVVL